MSFVLGIEVETDVTQKVARLGRALRAGRQLHRLIATSAEVLTRAHLRQQDRDIAHKTARRLGADPSGHLGKLASRIESDSTASTATIRGPRRSRLRAAFGTYTVRPTGGRKFLTIPADATTYNSNARDFPGQLKFSVVGGRFPALVFRKTGNVAFWLRKKSTVKADRSLLPFDQYQEIILEETEALVSKARADDDERSGGRA